MSLYQRVPMNLFKRLTLACLIAVFWLAQGRAEVFTLTLPKPSDRKVLIVSIDGLRPDVALRAEMPTLRALMKDGVFTFWAQSTAVSVTLPSHVSMLTGVTPARHEIAWNKDLPFSKPVYPKYPTVFEYAKAAGYTTALSAGKSKFAHLLKPKTVDWFYLPEKINTKVKDAQVAVEAIKLIEQHRPDVMFVHFPDGDTLGHSKGWGSAEQLQAMQQTDAALSRVLAAWRQAGLADQGLLLLTADHGGQGKGHGADDLRSRTIPWIAVGPGLKKDYDLANAAAEDWVRIEDTCATALDWLKLKVPQAMDGHSQLPWLIGKKLKQIWVETDADTTDALMPTSPEYEIR